MVGPRVPPPRPRHPARPPRARAQHQLSARAGAGARAGRCDAGRPGPLRRLPAGPEHRHGGDRRWSLRAWPRRWQRAVENAVAVAGHLGPPGHAGVLRGRRLLQHGELAGAGAPRRRLRRVPVEPDVAAAAAGARLRGRLAGTSAAARPLRGAAAADRAARQGHGPAAVVPRRLPGGRGPGTGYGAAAPALAAPGSRHAGLGALVALTGTGLFPPSMVGLPGDQSNMNPPTICIVAPAIWQLALVMLARGRVSAWLARTRPWTAVIAVGSMAMTVYLWHLTAMVTVLGLVLAAHGPLPTPGGALWWATRPIWLALLAAALTPMALFLSRFEHPAAGAPPPPSGPRARLRPCRAAARGPPRAPPGRARQASASPRWGGSL